MVIVMIEFMDVVHELGIFTMNSLCYNSIIMCDISRRDHTFVND